MTYIPPAPPQPYLPNVDWTVVTPVATRSDIESVAVSPSDAQLQVSADNAPLRIVYGRTRIGAQIADVLIYGGYLVVLVVWCAGEIDAVESVTVNDKALPYGTTVTHYTGTAGQTVNSLLVAAYASVGVTFTSAFPGVAYSVFRVAPAENEGFPEFAAIIRGKKVYDPRTTLTGYSNNPALCLADFLQAPTYGLNRLVDYADGVADAADYDDTLVGGEKRRLIGLAIDSVQPTRQWVEALRTYASCFLQAGTNGLRLIPDKAGTSAATFDNSSIVGASVRINKRGVMQLPTVIDLVYTDTTVLPWSEKHAYAKAAGVDEGTTPRRESQIHLPGIHRYSQARREAIERLNKLTLSDLTVSFTAFDAGVAIEEGDIITATHALGLAGKLLRVSGATPTAPGRWSLAGFEYDDASYSNVVEAEPTYDDTALPSPTAPPAITGLTVAEEVYQMDNGTFASRLLLEWDLPDYVHLDRHYIEVISVDGVIITATARKDESIYRTGPVQEAVAYQCNVAAVSTLGVVGAWSQVDITALGKYLVPGNVPRASGFEAGGSVYLSWEQAVDIDIWRYEVRYGITAGSWDTATVIDQVDALRLQSDEIPVGTWKFYVKAMDSVQQYSADPAIVTLTVTSDSGSFLVDNFDSTTPQWENICPYSENLIGWTKQTGVTIGSDVAVAPDGVTSADRIIEATSTQRHYIVHSITVAANTPYTFTVYAKAAQRNFIGVVFGKGGSPYSRAGVIVNLTTGSITSNYLADTVTSVVRHAVKDVGNGWFRISVTVVMDAASTDGIVELWPSSDGTASSYLGNTANGVYAWGAQLSQASYPHLYTKTTATISAATGKGMFSYRLAPTDPNVYYVTDDDVPFATKFSSALSTYTNPLAQYHNDVTSLWVGEAEDFGQVLGGQWTGESDVATINGSLTSYLGISQDGTNWNYFEGLSQKTNGRFARLKHEALTTATLGVTVPDQNVRLDAVPREEVGFGVLSLASGGKLIQLEGHYSAAKRIFITPESSLSRTGTYDRVLLAPDDGLALNDTSNGGGDSAAGQTINTTARVIASGDYLEYDFMVYECPASVSGSVGGFRIRYTNLTNSLAVDQYGNIIGGPSFVQGVWKSRKLSLAADVGLTVSHFALLRNADATGDYKALYRNIRITDGAGTTRLQIWESGEPAVNTVFVNSLSSNIKCGPSNSFMAYTFDGATQVANNFSWTFQGV